MTETRKKRLSQADRITKREATDAAAQNIIDREKQARDEKSARLRAAREGLARQTQ